MDPRIPTAQKTGMRPIQTAQKGLVTGIKGDGNFQGVGVPNLKIVERPVTKDGMTGMSTKPQSQGRVYQDKGYFMNILRQKTSDIIDQIKKFKEKVEQIQQDNQTYNNLQKRFDELIKQVRNLEGQLADYNLAFDKQRSQTRPEEIRNMYEHIKFQNQRQSEQLDEIFIERKNQEEQIMQIEQQINQLNQIAEQKITELDPDQRQEYDNLVKENRQLNSEINMQRQILDELNNKLAQVESRLRMDSQKLKGQYLKEQIIELSRKKEDLEMQLNEANLSFPEARDRLLNRVKEDNALIAQTDKRNKEIQKNIDNYEKKIRELNQELSSGADKEEQKKKYEFLYQKDKEITEFMENYENNRKREIEEIRQIENNIVSLLEQSSKFLAITGNLPSYQEYNEMTGNLKFKGEQAENSEKTLFALRQEVELRKDQLNKLESAEESVNQQMAQLKEKVQSMQSEIDTKFNRIMQIKTEFENKEKKLKKERDELQNYKNTVGDELRKINYDHNLKEKKLMMHEMYTSYSEAEKKYSNSQNTVNNLKNFIITKTKDMNYEGIREECRKLVEDINKILLK